MHKSMLIFTLQELQIVSLPNSTKNSGLLGGIKVLFANNLSIKTMKKICCFCYTQIVYS